jgi:hypothetical protein
MRLSLVAWRTTPDPTTWTAPGPPRGQERRYTPRWQQWVRTPTGKGRTPRCTDRTSWWGSKPPQVRTRPLGWVPDPSGGVRATLSRVPGFWDKEYPGLNQGQVGVRGQHVSGPYHVHFRSPLRRRPNAATWHIARDVSQWTEPDVRPLGRAALHLLRRRHAA